MAGLRVVRKQELGFDEHGNVANSDEVYIKVLGSFQDVLSLLRGARLHVFMCVATQEAKIIPGSDSALSLSSIQGIVNYARHTVIEALDFLVDRRFLDELPERAPTGEKLYRVASYAWYGKPRFSPGDSAKIAPVQKRRLEAEDIDFKSNEKIATPTSVSSAKILHSVGVYASHLPEIEVERSKRWAEFVKLAPRHTFRNPAGFCFAELKKDPQAEPPTFSGAGKRWWGGDDDKHVNR